MKPHPHPLKNSQGHLLSQIAKTLRDHRSYLVASHVRPDGDAVGSSLAMGMLLKKLGKQVTIWNDDGLPLKYAFLRNSKLLQRTPNEKAVARPFDVIVALDTANFARLGRASKSALPGATNRASKGSPTKAPILINIDHHESNERYGDISWIEPHHAATSQLLFDLFRSQQFTITPEIASCLFVGIQTDTEVSVTAMRLLLCSVLPPISSSAARMSERSGARSMIHFPWRGCGSCSLSCKICG